jgi:hypothetical protein
MDLFNRFVWAVEGCVATCVGGYDYLPKRGHTIASIPYKSISDIRQDKHKKQGLFCDEYGDMCSSSSSTICPRIFSPNC